MNRQYGGPGVFVPSEESPGHRQQGSGSSHDSFRRDSSPSSVFPSNSSMGLDLYKPEYEQTVRAHAPQSTSMEHLVNDMGELVFDPRRRDTFPVRIRCSPVFPLFYAHLLLEPSRCNRTFRRDLYRLQGILLRHPRLRLSFQYQRTRVMTPQLLVLLTEL